MRAKVDVSFWSDEKKWPDDPLGYIFLLRAVKAVGRAMFPNDWTGSEYLTVIPQAREWSSADSDQIKRLKNELIENSKRATDRFEQVSEQFVWWLSSGELTSASWLRQGAPHPLRAERWLTERWGERFSRGQLSDDTRYLVQPPWISVTSESLDRLVRLTLERPIEQRPEGVRVELQVGPGRPRGTGLPFNKEIAKEATRLWTNGNLTQAEAIRVAVKNLRDNGKPIPVDGSYTDRYAIDRIRRMMPPAEKRK